MVLARPRRKSATCWLAGWIAVSGRGLPGRRLIVGVCRLGCRAEQTRALCDSWHATGEPLVSAAHCFLPANEEARLLVLGQQRLTLIILLPGDSFCFVLCLCREMEIRRTGGTTGRCERDFVYVEETLHPVFGRTAVQSLRSGVGVETWHSLSLLLLLLLV